MNGMQLRNYVCSVGVVHRPAADNAMHLWRLPWIVLSGAILLH
jgi:hypothetical protein